VGENRGSPSGGRAVERLDLGFSREQYTANCLFVTISIYDRGIPLNFHLLHYQYR
jgi:hypothetical protein